jgi:hypothetical protein
MLTVNVLVFGDVTPSSLAKVKVKVSLVKFDKGTERVVEV